MASGNRIGWAALTNTVYSGKKFLNLALTAAGTIGTSTLCLGKRNIAIANNGGYGYLCIVNDTSGSVATQTASIGPNLYSLASSGLSYCVFAEFISNNIATNSLVLGNVAIAVNSNGDIIAQDCTASVGTPDQEDVIFIGSTPLRVVRKGSNWYLVANVQNNGVNYFVPSYPGNLVLWLEANSGTLNSGGTACTNGQGIATWQDQSGNGNNVIQPTSGNQPTFVTNVVGSNPTVRFTQSSNNGLYLTDASGTSALNLTGNFTVSFVLNVTGWGGTSNGLVGKKINDSSNGWQVYNDSGQPTKIDMRITQTNQDFTNTSVPSGVSVWSFVKNGTTGYWYYNGVLDSTTTVVSSTSLTTDTFWLGYAPTWSYYYNGDIGEIIIYSQNLSNTQRSQVESYLINKW